MSVADRFPYSSCVVVVNGWIRDSTVSIAYEVNRLTFVADVPLYDYLEALEKPENLRLIVAFWYRTPDLYWESDEKVILDGSLAVIQNPQFPNAYPSLYVWATELYP